MTILQLRPTITVERRPDAPGCFTISDGSRSVDLGSHADMPLVKGLLSDVLSESFSLEDFTKQSSPVRQITLVAGEPDYEYCLRLLTGRYEERFCIARRREDGGADYLHLTQSDEFLWISDPLCDDIALFCTEDDAQLVVNGEPDPTIEIQKWYMLKG